jgi:hypothetical protein
MTMKYLTAALLLAAATGLAALPAAAQGDGIPPAIKPIPKLPGPTTPKTPEAAPVATARLGGCIRHQVYNTQSVNHFSTAFTLITSDGDRQFNFGADKIRYIPPGAPLPLPTAAETLKWTRILDTLERAAAAGKPLLVEYTTPSNEVFGIYVQWTENCPAP